MLLSTSTTGILTLAAGFPMMMTFAALSGNGRAVGRLAKKGAVLLCVGAIIVVPAFLLDPSLQSSVNEVVNSTLSKGDSESYQERSGLDGAALATLAQTDGLGVGWGSFRASSLIPGLSANGGIFGLAMVLLLALQVTMLMRRARRYNPGHAGSIVLDGFGAALCGQLAAALVSAPTITSLPFYLQLGCVTGTAARMLAESRSARAMAPRAGSTTILSDNPRKRGSFA
jgi:hypothetical protein